MTAPTIRLLETDRLWFPDLANYLVANLTDGEQAALGRSRGSNHTPGLEAATAAPPHPTRRAPSNPLVRFGAHAAQVEGLPPTVAAEFGDLQFADSSDPAVTQQLQAAADLLDPIPTLADTVGAVVKSIHPLRADTDHDVSHSTPEMPLSVFVSVPAAGERDAAVRVAESIVHEAMHLQLTLLDAVLPLTDDDIAHGYSPWKQEQRPLTGLIHGLYVFAVIKQTLNVWASLDIGHGAYCRKRNSAIHDEVASLAEAPTGLTEFGADLWVRCRTTVLN